MKSKINLKILFLLGFLIIFENDSKASYAWGFRDFSILAGQQFRERNNPLTSINIQFDSYSKSCLTNKRYFGINANYSFTGNQKQLGIRAMINPSSFLFFINRKSVLIPYIAVQFNHIQSKVCDPIDSKNFISKDYSFRPAIGFTAVFKRTKRLDIRSNFLLGYDFLMSDKYKFKNPFSFEFNLGIGINLGSIKSKKKRS